MPKIVSTSEVKSKLVAFRVQEKRYAAYRKAAAVHGVSLPVWIRRTLYAAALEAENRWKGRSGIHSLRHEVFREDFVAVHSSGHEESTRKALKRMLRVLRESDAAAPDEDTSRLPLFEGRL